MNNIENQGSFVGSPELIRNILKGESEETIQRLLCVAIRDTDILSVELLLERNIELDIVDKYGNTFLMLASLQDNARSAKLLLDKGANPDTPDAEGKTPLMYAINKWVRTFSGYNLAKAYESPHAKEKLLLGRSAALNIAKTLLEYGADIGAPIAHAFFLTLLQETTSQSCHNFLLTIGLNTYSEAKDYLDDIHEQVRDNAKLMRAKLEQKVKEIARKDMSNQEVPQFLRTLTYNLKIYSIINHPTLEGTFEKKLDAHIIEYRCDVFLADNVWNKLIKDTIQYLTKSRKQGFFNDNQAPLAVRKTLENSDSISTPDLLKKVLRYFTNVFRALARESGLPAELMHHILDYVVESETLVNKANIPLYAMLPYYPYIQAQPGVWQAFHNNRFNPDFLTNSNGTASTASTVNQTSPRP